MRPQLYVLTALSLGFLSCKAPGGTVSPDAAPSPETKVKEEPKSTADILAESNLPPTQATPLVDDEAQVSVHRLSNGMTVYLSPSDEEPTFDAWIAVRTGSRNDPANSTGLAHYLEHMLFKGTHKLGTVDFAKEKVHIDAVAKLYDKLRKTKDPAKRKAIFNKIDQETQAMAQYSVPNELDKLYDSIGAKNVNAYTSNDGTVYQGTFPKNRLITWAKNESQRFQHPQFRLFFPELEAVYEEKNRSMDNPQSRAYEALFASVFPHHPYGLQSTIGTVEHLKTPAYGDMTRFYKQWYQPNNMAIVLSGNFDRREAVELLEKYFGSWQPQELVMPTPAKIEPLKARSLTKVQGPTHPSAILAWVTAPAGAKDEMALAVMDALVSHGSAGLVYEQLVLPQKLPHAGSFNHNLHEGGMWVLSGIAGHGQSPEQVEAQLLKVVESIRKGEFTDEQLAAVKLNMEVERKKHLESSRSRASAMTNTFLQRKTWQEVADYNKKLATITRDDVLRVANKYLTPAYAAVYQVRGQHSPPSIEKPKISPVKIDSSKKSAYFTEVLSAPVQPVAPRWLEPNKDYMTLTGLKPGFSVQNPRNDLFDLSFVYPVGRSKDPYLCLALGVAEKSGTSKKSAADIKKSLYALGSSVSTSCAADESVIRIQGVQRNLDATVKIVNDWLSNIQITQADSERYASNALSLRRTQLQNPKILSQALFQYAARGKDSPMLNALSNKQLAKVDGKALAKEIRNLLSTRYEVAYFGPAAADITKLATMGKATRKAPARKRIRYSQPKSAELLYIDTPQAQASINMRWNSTIKTAKDRVLAELANAYLGGMGGRLFQEVREARGLAYSVGAFARAGAYKDDDGQLVAFVGTQADKAPEAIEVVLAQLTQPVNPELLASAKLALSQKYRSNHISPRGTLSALRAWDKAGHKKDPRAEELALMDSIDAEQLTRYLQSVTKKPVQITIVGPKARLGLDKLAKFGTLKEMKPQQVFSYGAFPQAATGTKASRR